MSYTIADLRKGVEFVTHPCSPIDAITAAECGCLPCAEDRSES